MNKDNNGGAGGDAMEEEKCTCGHTKEEHDNGLERCRHGYDVQRHMCLCQYYSTLIRTCDLFVGVVAEDKSEDEDEDEGKDE